MTEDNFSGSMNLSVINFDTTRSVYGEQLRRSITQEIEAELQVLRAYQNNHGQMVVTQYRSYAVRDIIVAFEMLQDRAKGLPELADLRRVNCELDDLKRSYMAALQHVFHRVVEQDNLGSFEFNLD